MLHPIKNWRKKKEQIKKPEDENYFGKNFPFSQFSSINHYFTYPFGSSMHLWYSFATKPTINNLSKTIW